MKFAFTLSEVLITLGVIGVVAALTIPGLIQMYRRHEVEAKLQENYSKLAQCMKSILNEYDVDDFTGTELYIPVWDHHWIYTDKLVEQMKKHMKIVQVYDNKGIGAYKPIKMCMDGKNPPRTYKDNVYYIDLCGTPIRTHFNPVGNPPNYTYTAIELLDGTCMQINANGYAENWGLSSGGGMEILVDINGSGKGPNVVGIDTFVYIITLDGNVHMYGWEYPNGDCNGCIDRVYTGGVCKTNGVYGCGQSCGEKIRRNGWRTWTGYPWKPKIK